MEQEINKKYVKGFNHAYLLAKHKPQIIESIVKTKTQNEYIQGLKDGKGAFEQEKIKSRFQEMEKLHSQKDKSHDFDLER